MKSDSAKDKVHVKNKVTKIRTIKIALLS